MKPVRALVADDQKVVRDGLCLMLRMLGIKVTGAAVDGTDAMREATAAVPDVVLMDLHMPNSDRVEAIRLILRQQPDVRVVVLTALSDDDPASAALRAGARSLLTKNASGGEIVQAMSTVGARDAQLDPSVQRGLVEAFVRGDRLGVPGPWKAGSAPDGLTQREVEVLTEIATGLSNAEIAGKFRISGATVKSHINHLLAKTGTRDRAQLVAYAFRHGLAA
jgi:DNA-binding NarL/FixJ family response regulator